MDWEDEGVVWQAERLSDGRVRLSHLDDQGDFMMEIQTTRTPEQWVEILGSLTPRGLTPKVRMFLEMAFEGPAKVDIFPEDDDTDEHALE